MAWHNAQPKFIGNWVIEQENDHKHSSKCTTEWLKKKKNQGVKRVRV